MPQIFAILINSQGNQNLQGTSREESQNFEICYEATSYSINKGKYAKSKKL